MTSSPIDVVAVLAALQDQLDDLTAAMEAQQTTIDLLQRAVADLNGRRPGPGRP